MTTKPTSSLNIFDLDDTLFRSSAAVYVKRDGKRYKELSPGAYNTYQLEAGEEFDFSDFRSADTFHKTATPIKPVFNTAKRMMAKLKADHQRFIIVTARKDLDDPNKFLETFRKYGFDIDRTHVFRAGNIALPSPKAKQIVIWNELKKHPYEIVRMFDDAVDNLKAFLELAYHFPKARFEAFLIDHDGNIVRYGATSVTEDVGGAPANSAGGAGVAGIGVGPEGEPPGPRSVLKRLRRKKPAEIKEELDTPLAFNQEYFAGNPVFIVSDDYYHKCYKGKKKYHKYMHYVGADEYGEKIRQYGRKHYDRPIIIKNERTGTMLYLRYGKAKK